MSFAGDLEHLPIVDVIQLLHSTKKTGTLSLTSSKGESQLVFNDGYIVSANHVRNNVRIGQILVEMGAITSEQLEQALLQQIRASNDRKPLIATLIEAEVIDQKTAFSSLETLIELTIVEILTWTQGTFALNVDSTVVNDEYRYFPEILKQDVHINTQGILMDALRVYDEKMRDGTLQKGPFPVPPLQEDTGEPTVITADLLGLDELDALDKKIPDVFMGVKEYDSTETHRQKIREHAHNLPQAEQERLLSLLVQLSDEKNASNIGQRSPPSSLAVIYFGKDAFVEHLISTICKHEEVFVFSTDDESNLDLIINQSFSRQLEPLLLIDAPLNDEKTFSQDSIVRIARQKRENFPRITIQQFSPPHDGIFPLRALQAGVHSVVTKPLITGEHGSSADPVISFIKSFQNHLRKTSSNSGNQVLQSFKNSIIELESQRRIPDAAFVVLKFASSMFKRCITLVVGDSKLIAEKGFGVKGAKSNDVAPPLLFTIPLSQPSVFLDTIQNGRYFYGPCNDTVLKDCLHKEIGAPQSPKMLLMPLKAFGKVIALIYGDFGDITGAPMQIDLLDILARHASLVVENGLYLKKLRAGGQNTSNPASP